MSHVTQLQDVMDLLPRVHQHDALVLGFQVYDAFMNQAKSRAVDKCHVLKVDDNLAFIGIKTFFNSGVKFMSSIKVKSPLEAEGDACMV